MIRPDPLSVHAGENGHVRGTVIVRRADGEARVFIRLRGSVAHLPVEADDLRPVVRVEGAGVVAFGRVLQKPRRLLLTRFVVVSMGGVPAVDGILERFDSGLVLVTADGGRLPIPWPPDGLREHVGARVWVAGDDLGDGLRSFGVIEGGG